jgi:hypothetical protein
MPSPRAYCAYDLWLCACQQGRPKRRKPSGPAPRRRSRPVYLRDGERGRADRADLRRALARMEPGDVLLVTRLDRLARSSRDLMNALATIADSGARFCSPGDLCTETASSPPAAGRCSPSSAASRGLSASSSARALRRPGAGEGLRCPANPQAGTSPAPTVEQRIFHARWPPCPVGRVRQILPAPESLISLWVRILLRILL